MKKLVLLLIAFSFILRLQAQTKTSSRKYPSLFWEITGNGLSRPSYLFGTMHVSSKLVFHLPDSFYLAIKSVDVVALETNPESWQEDLVKYDLGDNNSLSRLRYPWSVYKQMPDDYLNIRTLQFNRYEKQIEAALYSRPSTINNLLYRNYSDFSSDFEENTYLDMYIYQVGKKMGKRVAGVEKYEESMKLMMEAYRDAAKDKNHKQRSYDYGDDYSADKLQEAYRTGNLDLLDSINRLNSFSDAFDEKFLYSRNLLQANSIDSILKSRSSLFVGVGAAHLPGSRGVIEILRKRGYKLRPIIMGERDGTEKDIVEKLRVPVNFSTQTSEDGFFKVDIPGKFYRFTDEGLLDQLQYADMANGSYYMVTRIKTSSLVWHQSEGTVKRKIDSLLYENVPGKILSRQNIVRNGYNGIDIVNRTRRGDVQRYNIFITPYEVIIFKMSGNADYVRDGVESKKFFGSIWLKEYDNPAGEWKKFEPSYGGFSVDLPHEPFISKGANWQYESEDKSTGNNYTILRTDIHNYGFAEEDTFDLDLMDESFSGSAFVDKELSRKFSTWKGYPALDCRYLHKDGSVIWTRFIIQGPHYYSLVAQGKKEDAGMRDFFNSFAITPFIYKQPFYKKDTSLCYAVTTTFFPEDKKIKITIPGNNDYSLSNSDDNDDDDAETSNFFSWGSLKNSVIENDTTGEKIYVSCYKNGRYFYNADSSGLDENRITRNGSWIIRNKKKYSTPGGWQVVEFNLSDTNSSRLVWTKSFYKEGVGFFLATEGDTLTGASSFVKSFYSTFTPIDTLKGFNPFEKKSACFFSDFFNGDTLIHKRAVRAIDEIKLDSADLPKLQKAIDFVNWSDRKYLETKKSLIGKLGDIDTKASADLLKKLYYAEEDTIDVQYAVLESLLGQQTQYAFSVFKDILMDEPPIIEVSPGNDYSNGYNLNHFNLNFGQSRLTGGQEGNFWDGLYDSVKLTRTILPAILPLVNLDDYKWKVMALLERMIDSNLVKASDYETYFSKFFLEARQEWKKQVINEKRKLIKAASEKNSMADDTGDDEDNDNDYGNGHLETYAKLLLPFWETNTGVPPFFAQLLRSSDDKLKYNVMLLMMENDKTVPDSLLNYFASMDDYRYDLYSDLDDNNQLKFFPAKYNNHVDLARGKLVDSKAYQKPDSITYLNKLPATFDSKQGYVYFFKYKEKKDDPVWKLASVGLISKDPGQFEIKCTSSQGDPDDDEDTSAYDFTSFTDTKLKLGEPLDVQLNKELKVLLYSKRKSAREFYDLSKPTDDAYSLQFRN